MSEPNTLFLRLAGPMQSWGTSSRLQLRRTDAYPSKSGVLGLLLCAKGVRREDSGPELERLNRLLMGVRVDLPGRPAWDYHTVGAKIGIRKAEGGIKYTESTKQPETLLSRRQYLHDASFLVALCGQPETIADCAAALDNPVWPVFLGRKCCIPSEPVFVPTGTGTFPSLVEALAGVPWRARIDRIDRRDRAGAVTLDTFVEHPEGTPPPADAILVHDVPRQYGFWNQEARWVVPGAVTVPVGSQTQCPPGKFEERKDPYGPEWPGLRQARMELDKGLCVFCKSPAVDVHHVDYQDVRIETLRSLCKRCHDACTMLEYGVDMHARRIDPADPNQRPAILEQLQRMLAERRLTRRRELLEAIRPARIPFFDDSWPQEDA